MWSDGKGSTRGGQEGARCEPDNIRITTREIEETNAWKAEDDRCTERDKVGRR